MLKKYSFAILVTLFWSGLIWVWTSGFSAFSVFTYAWEKGERYPAKAPRLYLKDHTGKAFHFPDNSGQYTLVDFVYFHCSKICGLVVSDLVGYMKNPDIDRYNVRFLTISFDSARDTRQVLGSVKSSYGEFGSWRVAASDPAYYKNNIGFLRTILRYGIVVENAPGGRGDFNHSAFHLVISPAGEIIGKIDIDKGVAVGLIELERLIQGYERIERGN